jgi:hypothetical protein
MVENAPIMLCDAGESQTNALASELARAAGHRNSTLTYPGSEGSNNGFDSFELDMEHLKEANRYLMRANKSMHRSWPRRQLNTDNALRRDSWISRWSHQIFMFGLFTQDASLLKINTDMAWAAQIYVDRFLYDNEPWDLCELYLFDMKSESWWQWKQQWLRIDAVPAPSGVYTVLGQDRLTNAGKSALKDLFAISQ